MRWALTGLCLGAALLAGRAAPASCIGPSGRVLWTYPADGAVDVPTNARLLVSDEFGSTPSLNGQALPVSHDGVFELGELAPNTSYRVTWPPGLLEVGPAISFTTGAGPSPQMAPGLPEPLAVTRDRSARSCPLVPAQGCFDTASPRR